MTQNREVFTPVDYSNVLLGNNKRNLNTKKPPQRIEMAYLLFLNELLCPVITLCNVSNTDMSEVTIHDISAMTR